jgi:glutathione synthase/RimK-type ligase-like ATP-grasp enzyme
VVRSTWDYYAHHQAFLSWSGRVAKVSSLWNNARTLEWNSHKSYLLHLEKKGIPVVPTVLTQKGIPANLDRIMREQDWSASIVKPAVSLGAIGVLSVEEGDPAGQKHLEKLLRSGDALVQPFVQSVRHVGETSAVFIGGEPTHMVRKTPATGDFRVQEQYGGTFEQIALDDNLLAIAQRALDTVAEPLLYARVDFVEIAGKPHIMEIELIEPSLYLEIVPSSTARFAEAIIARLP